MNNNRTTSMIDLVFKKYDTPAGPVFVARRHGRIKKCFSRDTAIRYLAFFMTTWAFECSGFQTNHPDVLVERDGFEMCQRGEVTAEYIAAHQRCMRRIRRILARKRDMQKWREKWDAMHDRFVKEVDALQACKPEGVH